MSEPLSVGIHACALALAEVKSEGRLVDDSRRMTHRYHVMASVAALTFWVTNIMLGDIQEYLPKTGCSLQGNTVM